MQRGERKTFCKRGHSLTDPANVRYNKRNAAVCRTCRRESSRRESLNGQLVNASNTNHQWTDDDKGVVADDRLTALQAAEATGRTVGAVRKMRFRLRRGQDSQREMPLCETEIDYVREHPEMTAQRVADEIERPYHLITKARRRLISEEGHSFGKGPYDKSPYMLGNRLLIAKSCIRCGVVRGGAAFSRNGHDGFSSTCCYCRAETREQDDRRGRDEKVQKRAEEIGVPYMSRHGEEYVSEDIQVLEDSALEIVEKAARLGRTYEAARAAANAHGFAMKRRDRPEPGGVWLIHPDGRTGAH